MTDNAKNINASQRGIETSAHETGMCEPQNLLELDLLYQQAEQRLRAEGAAAFGQMQRQRTEANDLRRRELARLRRELAELEQQIEETKAGCAFSIARAQDEYHTVSEDIAFRRSSLKGWFTRQRMRLAATEATALP